MMDAIRIVLGRLHRAGIDGETRAAIDRVLDALDMRYLTARAKASLLAREYDAAARDFQALRRLGGGSTRAAALAMLSSACPGLLRSVYRVRNG